jgi:hypothetical protein
MGEEKNQSKDWPLKNEKKTPAADGGRYTGKRARRGSRRVGEDEVDRGFGNECEEFEGIAEG